MNNPIDETTYLHCYQSASFDAGPHKKTVKFHFQR